MLEHRQLVNFRILMKYSRKLKTYVFATAKKEDIKAGTGEFDILGKVLSLD